MKTKKLSHIAGMMTCTMPMIYFFYVVIFWLLASAALGQWAQPGVHDPKNFFFGIPAALGVLLMLMSFAIAPLVLAVGRMRGKLGIYLLSYGICLASSIALFRADILQMTTWIAD